MTAKPIIEPNKKTASDKGSILLSMTLLQFRT
jgi:hypothetical protein